MADATHISLKVKLDDDIRRFSVSKSINFVELHALISKHFVLAPESVQVKYIDDEEELITLGSDLELEEAKRLQPTVLRLNVYDSKPRRHTTDQPPSTPKLEAAFVRDVTVPDGTNVSARVKFQKSWCVKNTGSTAWPKGVVLKTVDPKDDQLLAFSAGAINRAVGPGEETVIGVDLQAPARPGRCVQHWRLFTEDGVAFGSRLWVDVTVGPSPQDNAAAEEEERELAEAEARRQAEQAELEQRLKEEDRLREELLLQEAEAMRRAAEEAEEAERQRLELEMLLAEEERKKLEEELMKQQAEEEELRRREEEVRRKLEEELRRREQEENERRKLEEERRKLEEEKRKLVEEEERRRKQEEEENRKQEEEKRRLLNSKYPGQLTALAEMGFTNVEHNVKLLDKHKGSLDLALEALLSGH